MLWNFFFIWKENTYVTGSEEQIELDWEDDDEDDDDYDYDWGGVTGNFTKKYNAFASHSQQVVL